MKLWEFFTKNGWTKQYLAKDKNRKPVCTNNKNAVSFCLMGAVAKIHPKSSDKQNRLFDKLRSAIRKECSLTNGSIVEFNDERCKDKRQLIRFLKRNDV